MLKGIQEAYEVALDMKSIDTIRTVSSFTEAEQKKSTIVLANKLYGMIVDRLDQIDFKEIEKSEGDITEFKYYNRTRECISVLKGLAKQSGSGVEEIDVIETALNNIESNRLFFIRAYKTDCSFIKSLYNTMIMAIISDISFMITVCVEYIKNPDHTVQMEITNLKKFKSKFYLVHKNLRKFNEAVEKGELEKVCSTLLKIKSKNLAGETTIIGWLTLNVPGFQFIALIAAAIIIIKTFVPIMRELSYFFYFFRTKISDYFFLQQQLLEANALKLKQMSTDDPEKNEKIAKRQEKIASIFGKIGNFFAVKYTPAADKAENDPGKTTIDKSDVNGDSNEPVVLF